MLLYLKQTDFSKIHQKSYQIKTIKNYPMSSRNKKDISVTLKKKKPTQQ